VVLPPQWPQWPQQKQQQQQHQQQQQQKQQQQQPRARSRSPRGRSRSPTLGVQLLVGGRGAKQLQLVTLPSDGRSAAHLKCPKGCTLDVVDCTAGAGRRGARRRDVAVDVIDSEHPELKTKFVLTQGVPECKQCPGCKQRVLKIKLADMGSQPQQPLRLDNRGGRQKPAEKGAIRSSGRYAFSAALWASEDGSKEDLEKYIADAIHVGFQLQA
jgi:hypothetical protein